MTASVLAATAAAAASPSAEAASFSGSPLYDQLHYYTVGVFEKYGDPRVSNYHLMRTPWPTIGATLLYYWFVRSIGPKLMRDRKAYQILPLIRVYNLMMAAWNGLGFYYSIHLVNYGLDLVGCRPVDPNQRDERTLSQIYYGWMFYTSRLVEFADTVFFVLRKKDSQITSFHVFHHSSVPTATWFFLKFAPGGNSGVFPFINTVIHTIMYSYYLLATYPSMRPYLGWKKYLTQLQIVQFFIIIACCMQPLFIPGCKFPRVLLFIMMAFSFVFIYLFVDFYLKSYRQKKSSSTVVAKQKLMLDQKQQRHDTESPPSTSLSSSLSTSMCNGGDEINNNNNNNNDNHNSTSYNTTNGAKKVKIN